MPQKERIFNEKELISRYESGDSIRELGRFYKTDRRLIKRVLIRGGVKMRTLSEANRTFGVDDHAFEKIDSHEKAYWLGFLAGDGTVVGSQIKIGLSLKDITHLEKFKSFIKSERKIYKYDPIVNGKKYHACYFAINSPIMVKDLYALNITQKKSNTLRPSCIDKEFINSYLLGLIDADGCFYVDKRGQMHLNLISTLSICEFAMSQFVENCGIKPTKIIIESRSKAAYYCYFGGNTKVKKIIDFLYKNSPVCLARKNKIVENHYKE
jgi:hypothetical protein